MGAESDQEEKLYEEEEEKRYQAEVAYWEEVWKCNNGFEIDHLKIPKRFGFVGVAPISFKEYNYDDELPLLILYAKIGVHKFNMSKGTNLQFDSLDILNELPEPGHRTYHITLLVKETSRQFQTSLVHLGHRKKSVTWFTARFKPKHPRPGRLHYGPRPDCYRRELPEWPPENDFSDKKRFYLVEESELLKYAWIRLYMEFAFVEENEAIAVANPDLSKLVILMVAVEPMGNAQPPNEDVLMARDATFYIRYTYPYMGHRSQRSPRHRIAIIRRTIKKDTLSLLFMSSFAKKSSSGVTTLPIISD
ncbi:PREDICTED: UPF0725 protein At1g02770-like [Camelina sativa]|uniref:UPF0725 protein At1g02770-like n=1 Tax=Camelina sativa TaxID=90675 RepID=A0ABM0VYH5_CAMSA|nr:PREDICTED: UPF0725 protein At1g02770-like [Camelina sativa]